MKIITHSDRMPTNRDRLNAWSQGDYRQKRDAEMARELENKEKEMCQLDLNELRADERAQITAAWAKKTARANRRAQIRRAIDVVSFAIGFAGVCAILYARAMGWL